MQAPKSWSLHSISSIRDRTFQNILTICLSQRSIKLIGKVVMEIRSNWSFLDEVYNLKVSIYSAMFLSVLRRIGLNLQLALE